MKDQVDVIILEFHKRMAKQKEIMQPFCKICLFAFSLDNLSCQSCIIKKRLSGVIT